MLYTNFFYDDIVRDYCTESYEFDFESESGEGQKGEEEIELEQSWRKGPAVKSRR